MNIIFGYRAGHNLEPKISINNILIGSKTGYSIQKGCNNFIFGDNELGRDEDNQFIVKKDMPTLTLEELASFRQQYPQIIAILPTSEFSDSEQAIIKEKMLQVFNLANAELDKHFSKTPKDVDNSAIQSWINLPYLRSFCNSQQYTFLDTICSDLQQKLINLNIEALNEAKAEAAKKQSESNPAKKNVLEVIQEEKSE